jgi:REP element-mobilizing transposase RayT
MDRRAAHRLRYARISTPGQLYLLTTVTRHRKPMFAELLPARLLISQLRHAQEQQMAKSLAWVVMPDHLHWLVELQNAPLDSLMRQVKCRTTQLINQKYQLHRPLWQKGYYDRAVRREDDIKTIARYIVANPLRAGRVRPICEYSHWDAVWL